MVVTVIATAPAGAVVVAIAAAPASLVIIIAFTPATSVGIVPTATTSPFLRTPVIAITPASAVIAHVARALTVTACQMMLARPRRLLGKPALLDNIKAAVESLGRISDLGKQNAVGKGFEHVPADGICWVLLSLLASPWTAVS